MDIVNCNKGKKNLILKAREWCRSVGAGSTKFLRSTFNSLTKCKGRKSVTSSVGKQKQCKKVAPAGCFTVYVGPQKQRFVVKTKFINHPLFVKLLEDAELEYGYSSEGPIVLPCDVDLFYKVLAEMDSSEDDDDITPPGCGSFASRGYGSLMSFNPARHSKICSNKIYGDYSLLSPSRMLKMNQL